MTLHGAGANATVTPRWAYAIGFGVRSPTRVVQREYAWNGASQRARSRRFAASLSGRQKLAYLLRSAVLRLGV
jgi:hypothetical protein